jgi:hypothetical protein
VEVRGVNERRVPCAARLVELDLGIYGWPGRRWCEVVEVLGEGARRPVRVWLPNGEIGAFGHEEVVEWRG